MAPPEDKMLGFLGLVSFISPTLSAARWMGLSSPASLREVMVRVAVAAKARVVTVVVVVFAVMVFLMVERRRAESIVCLDGEKDLWKGERYSYTWWRCVLRFALLYFALLYFAFRTVA